MGFDMIPKGEMLIGDDRSKSVLTMFFRKLKNLTESVLTSEVENPKLFASPHTDGQHWRTCPLFLGRGH